MEQFQRVVAKKIGESTLKEKAAEDKDLELPHCKQCDIELKTKYL